MAPLPLGFVMFTFILLRAKPPAEGFRTPQREPELAGQALGLVVEGSTGTPLPENAAVVAEPQQVDWVAGEVVGWVGEGTDEFPVGGRAQILDFSDHEGKRFANVNYHYNVPDTWTLNGSGCVMNGDCITSRNYPYYLSGAYCRVELGGHVGLSWHSFDTESRVDILTVGTYPDKISYSGSMAPPNGTYSGSITWRTDGSVVNLGWKMCKASCDGFQLIPIDPAACPTNVTIDPCHLVSAGQLCGGQGECGTNTSLNNCDGANIYRKVANLHSIEELYKVNATEYDCEGGSRAKFTGPPGNSANILRGQEGIVQSFGFINDEHLVNWWDLRQQKGWAVPPLWLRCQQPYWPRGGNGAWVGLHSVDAGQFSCLEKFGTQKNQEETTTAIWADELAHTLSNSMQFGVGFGGFGIELAVGGESSDSVRQEQSQSHSYSWSMNGGYRNFQIILPPNSGYLWQWQIRSQLANGDVYTSKTRDYAVTASVFEKPRCVPGYQIDGAACQVCRSEEATIKGLPAIVTTTSAPSTTTGTLPSAGLLFGSLAFGVLHQQWQL